MVINRPAVAQPIILFQDIMRQPAASASLAQAIPTALTSAAATMPATTAVPPRGMATAQVLRDIAAATIVETTVGAACALFQVRVLMYCFFSVLHRSIAVEWANAVL